MMSIQVSIDKTYNITNRDTSELATWQPPFGNNLRIAQMETHKQSAYGDPMQRSSSNDLHN